MTSKTNDCQALTAKQRLENQYKSEYARNNQPASAPAAPPAEQRTAQDEAHWNKLVENYAK